MSDDLVKRLRLEAAHDLEWASNPVEVLGRAADRIEQLESERDHYVNKLMEACSSYTDMHLRIEELEARLKKAVEALEWVKFGGGPRGESYHELACRVLAELKDTKC